MIFAVYEGNSLIAGFQIFVKLKKNEMADEYRYLWNDLVLENEYFRDITKSAGIWKFRMSDTELNYLHTHTRYT